MRPLSPFPRHQLHHQLPLWCTCRWLILPHLTPAAHGEMPRPATLSWASAPLTISLSIQGEGLRECWGKRALAPVRWLCETGSVSCTAWGCRWVVPPSRAPVRGEIPPLHAWESWKVASLMG